MITSFGGLTRNGNNGTVSVNLDLKQKLEIYFLIAECVLNFILEVGTRTRTSTRTRVFPNSHPAKQIAGSLFTESETHVHQN